MKSKSRITSHQSLLSHLQDKVHVDIYRRLGDDWEIESLSYGDTIRLTSVSLETPVEKFYEDVLGSMAKPKTP